MFGSVCACKRACTAGCVGDIWGCEIHKCELVLCSFSPTLIIIPLIVRALVMKIQAQHPRCSVKSSSKYKIIFLELRFVLIERNVQRALFHIPDHRFPFFFAKKKKKWCAVTCAARLVVPGEILIEMLRTTLTVREQIFVLYASWPKKSPPSSWADNNRTEIKQPLNMYFLSLEQTDMLVLV